MSRVEQKVKKREDSVATMENRIQELDDLFADTDIYSPEKQEKFHKLYLEHQELKNSLETVIQQWETAHTEFDRINNRIGEIDNQSGR